MQTSILINAQSILLLYDSCTCFNYRRGVIVKEGDNENEDSDVTPVEYSVRTVANEYGGGDFCVLGDTGTLIFSNYDDQRLYKQSIDSKG